MNKKNFVIAIDGHSSCGKSTLAKQMAKLLDIVYVDSGAMYRAVTLYMMRQSVFSFGLPNVDKVVEHLKDVQIEFKIINGQLNTFLNDENVENEIRGMDVSEKVSLISAIPEVRCKLVEWQQQMAESVSLIMDGRDIGTVVFPSAEVKLFVTADAKVRAERRFLELKEKGENPNFEAVYANVVERDTIDSQREVSPLRQAEDAHLVDNSKMTKEEQLTYCMNIVKETLEN